MDPYDSSTLCRVCAKIDFEKAVFKYIPTKNLGTWRSIRENPSCPFCRLVTACIRSRPHPYLEPDDRLVLTPTVAWERSVMSLFYDGGRSDDYSNFYDLKDKAEVRGLTPASTLTITVKGNYGRPLGELQYVASHEDRKSKVFLGRRVDHQEVNWRLLRSWLPRCEDCHLGLCDKRGKASRDLPANLRVIDIEAREIITAPENCRYCAMTYVWGPNTRDRKVLRLDMLRRDRNGQEYALLPPKLPRTIVDSMTVARRLGFSYLWNDSLCILQDGGKHMNSQIWRMDAIYNSATLTIAAASSPSADYGLPGVSVPRAFPQIREVVQGLEFAIPFPSYVDIHDSRSLIWNTRGWTFQEKLLSKRLLLFTDQQVYFKCSNAIWCEDTVLEINELSKDKRRRLDPFRWVADRTIPKRPALLDRFIYYFRSGSLTDVDDGLGYLPNYIALVEEYTRRTLTNPSDAVKAVQGILNTLNFDYHRNFEIAGLPRKYLSSLLLWQPFGGSATLLPKSLSKAPSWSWAAWKLSEGCTWYERDYRATTCYHKLVDPAPRPRTPFELTTMYILSRNADGFVDVKEKSWGISWEDLPEPISPPNVRRRLDEVGYLLCFHTLVYRFFVGQRLQNSPSNSNQVNCVELFEITDVLDNTIGEIWMSRDEAYPGQRMPRDFILLSFGTAFDRATVPQLYVPQQTQFVQDDSNVNYATRNHQLAPPVGKVRPLSASFEGLFAKPEPQAQAQAKPQGLTQGLQTQTPQAQMQPQRPPRPVIVNIPPSSWVVGNVMLVEFEDGIARRVAVGKVIKTALERNQWRESWVRLG